MGRKNRRAANLEVEFGDLTVQDDAEVADGEEVAEEEQVVIYTEDDIPAILEGLRSTDEETDAFDKATQSLTSIVENQSTTLASAHIIPVIPTLLEIIGRTHAKDESRRSSILDVLCAIAESPIDGGRRAIEAQLDTLVGMLKVAETMDQYSLVNLLEVLLEGAGESEENEVLESRLVDLLKGQIYVGVEDVKADELVPGDGGARKFALHAIEVFEMALVREKEHLRDVSLRAGALDFLILAAITDKSDPAAEPPAPAPNGDDGGAEPVTNSQLRLAAISCLTEVYTRIVDGVVTASSLPVDRDPSTYDRTSKLYLQSLVVVPLLDLVDGADAAVSDAVVEFLYGYHAYEPSEEQAGPVVSLLEFIWAHEGAMRRIISKLALESTPAESADVGGVTHSQTEWLLSVLVSKDEKTVVSGFKDFWESGLKDDGETRRVKRQLEDRVLSTGRRPLLESVKGAAVKSMPPKESSSSMQDPLGSDL
ncbi:hypothetical protein DFP72DRAFT_613794 [Ephemerocybe angulata]|uniref:Uncharacterized protein n=1 Tax=Ephemerocybe angulata TaxID=980116 RepID=A0A8H6HHM4_9AGAR|nr:hypothetical protein DFP72DRAFT_613794 [Tulosesus angulatus]